MSSINNQIRGKKNFKFFLIKKLNNHFFSTSFLSNFIPYKPNKMSENGLTDPNFYYIIITAKKKKTR